MEGGAMSTLRADIHLTHSVALRDGSNATYILYSVQLFLFRCALNIWADVNVLSQLFWVTPNNIMILPFKGIFLIIYPFL